MLCYIKAFGVLSADLDNRGCWINEEKAYPEKFWISLFYGSPGLLAQLFLKSGRQQRYEGEQITDHAVARNCEDGRFSVLIDGYD